MCESQDRSWCIYQLFHSFYITLVDTCAKQQQIHLFYSCSEEKDHYLLHARFILHAPQRKGNNHYNFSSVNVSGL